MMISTLHTALWATPGLLLLVFLLLRKDSKARKLVGLLSFPVHRAELIRNFSYRRMVMRTVLQLLTGVFLWGALLRVQYDDGVPSMALLQGRDVVIAVDISRSMLASDDAPSRLACAQQKIEELFKRLPTERVALIVFSGSALVQCPLTKDFDTFRLFLNALDVATLSTGGTTALDSALQAALDLFKQAQQQRNKLLVIFTDGEDFSQNLSSVQQQAQALQLHVCTVGVGTLAGAPIPEYNAEGVMVGHVHEQDGSIAISRLDETRLKKLAHDLHGLYIRLDTTNNKDIDALVRWVQSFEKEEFGIAQQGLHGETFMYCIAAALLFLIISWIL